MSSAGSERDRFVLVLFYGVLRLAGYLTFRVVALPAEVLVKP
jgi:hypothetical protein